MEVLFFAIGVFIIFFLIGYSIDKRQWNKGKCRVCGMPLEHFDNDSQGGRGYKCKCGNYIWVSYPVD